MIKRLLLLIGLSAAAGAAQAAIAPASSGNGELFLNVYDADAKVSYVLDLGLSMGLGLGSNPGDDTGFLVIAQQDIGYQRFWALDSAVWTEFQSLISPSQLRWSVLALDSTGALAAGTHRLLTTARQGDETKIANLTNAQLSNGVGATQGGLFFGTVNAKGTHVPQTDYTVNGESYALITDPNFGYYGKSGGLTPTLNNNAPFDAANAVGKSSWFYLLSRSGGAAGSKVVVDEFDNLGHDGYWGFVKVEDTDTSSPFYNPSSPYAGKYLLSFTMPAISPVVTSSFRSFAQSIARTEYSGALATTALAAAATAAAPAHAAGWVTPLALQGAVAEQGGISAVPEPASWLLLLAGALLGLLGLRRLEPGARR